MTVPLTAMLPLLHHPYCSRTKSGLYVPDDQERQVLNKWMIACCGACRYANIGGLGFQEKLVLQNKARDALEKGDSPPDMPGMDQAVEEMNAKKV